MKKEVLDGLKVAKGAGELNISWRRRYLAAGWLTELILFFFGTAVLFSSLSWLVPVFSGPSPRGFQAADLFSVFMLLAGILLVYRTLALLVNTDRVEVTPQQLRDSSGPLPPWDGTRVKLGVERVESVETSVVASSAGKGRMKSGKSITYSVIATLVDGSRKTLVSGSSKSEAMYFIGNEISRYIKEMKGKKK
jgi:hypothetical protein